MRSRRRRVVLRIGVGGLLAAAGGVAGAQDAVPTTASSTGSALTAAAPPGVSVPDSPGAADLLDKAAAKEQQQQWTAAADLYQQLLQKYAARVLPVAIDPDSDTFRYTGVATVVQDRIAHWPADGLTAYRATFGPPAADALAAANTPLANGTGSPDLAALDRIFAHSFVTDAGKTAGLELIDLLFESGRFDEAAAVGDRLLASHPVLDVERPAVLFRVGVCRYRAGNIDTAKQRLEELRQRFPQATGTVAGQDVLLVDTLAKLLAQRLPVPFRDAVDADTWPTFGGAADHAGVSSSAAKAGASITRFELIQPSLNAIDPQRRAVYLQSDENGLSQGEGVGIMPVTDGHALFFQDGRHAYAVDLNTGRPLPEWLATYPTNEQPNGDSASSGGVYRLNLPGRPRSEQLTTTVSPDAVLAVMGQPDHTPFLGAAGLLPASPRVVCLEKDTGRLRWSAQAADLPESAGNARNAEYAGPVRVAANDIASDSVLVCAIGGRERQFAECYLVCLSLKTGKYQWSTYLGSASQNIDGEPNTDRPLAPQLTVAGTTAYVSSNVGTVAAVDVAAGQIQWLNGYPRDAVDIGDANVFRARLQGIAPPAAPKAWALNPPVVSNGLVYVLPADGKSLRVYDAETGAQRQRVPTSDFDDADVLLGVLPATADMPAGVVISTARGVYCIDPAAYTGDDAKKNSILWERKDVAADMQSGDENTIFGRGLLTQNSVFVSTRHRLYQLSIRTGGKVEAMVPRQGSWSGNNEPGNVLATANDVIIAGSRGIDVYADLNRVRQHFAELINAAPADPMPRIALSDALFNAGDPQAALAKLDEAMTLAGAPGALPVSPAQQSILAEALNFARRTAAMAIPADAGSSDDVSPRSPDDALLAVTDALYDRAKLAAVSPSETVEYLLARARFDHDRKDLRAEVLLCQQILNDVAMRRLAGDEATTEIADAATADPSAYAPVQQQAQAAVDAARVANDAAQLIAVADIYPNSSAATAALEAAATLDETRGDPQAAIAALRRAYADPAFSSDAGEQQARRLLRIARDFADTPGGGAAAVDRLCAALRWQPSLSLTDPMRLPDGQILPVGTPAVRAVAALRTILSHQQEADLPSFQLAKTAAWSTPDLSVPDELRIPQITALLLPQSVEGNGSATVGRPDRIVAVSQGSGLSVYAPGSRNPRWNDASVTTAPLDSAWIGDVLAVWDADRVRLWNDGAAGTPVGAVEVKSLPAETVVTAAEPISDTLPDDPTDVNVNVPQPMVVGPRRRIIIRNGVRVVNGGFVGNGVFVNGAAFANVPAPVAGSGPVQISSAVAAGNRLVISTSDGQLAGVESGNGTLAWHVRISDRAPDHLLANAHFVVARFDDPGGSQLSVVDAISGKLLGTRRFGIANTPGQLINAALSEEGTLILTTGARLLAKDLYEPWKLPPVELVAGPDASGPAPFAGLGGDRQLLVHLGQVMALYDGGAFLRVHDLSARNAVSNTPDGAPPAESDPLSTGTTTPAVSLHPVGSRLYALTSTSFVQYNLASNVDHYMPVPYDLDYPPRLQDLLLGRDYAIVIDQPKTAPPLPAIPPNLLPANLPKIKPVAGTQNLTLLLAYNRSPVSASNPKESGKLDYAPTRHDDAGFTAWQALEGGICFLTGDQQLHVVMASR